MRILFILYFVITCNYLANFLITKLTKYNWLMFYL